MNKKHPGLRVLLCVLFAFGSLLVRAQKFEIENYHGLQGTAFDSDTRTFYTIAKDTVRAYAPPEYNPSLVHAIVPEYPDFTEQFLPIYKDSSLYLVHRQGGLVYRLEKDSLYRLDHSFNHKMQINSTIFVRNDTIYRYGGYGFWSHRNFFTYFSPETLEWEIITAEGSDRLPHGSQNSWVTQTENELFVFAGTGVDPTNPLSYVDFRQAWRFDTGARRWEFLGALEHDFRNWQLVAHLGDRVLLNAYGRNNFALVDPVANKIQYFPIEGTKDKIVSHKPLIGDFHSYYADGTLYLLKRRDFGNRSRWDGELYVEAVPWEGFLGKPVQEEPLYFKTEFPWKTAAGALLVLGVLTLGWIGYKRSQERGKVVLTRKGARYGRQHLDFDARSLAVLRLMLETEGDVPNQEILDIVENPALNAAHNTKVKNQLIESLNFRLKALLDLEEDPIRATRSEEDKRVKVYSIDKDLFMLR